MRRKDLSSLPENEWEGAPPAQQAMAGCGPTALLLPRLRQPPAGRCRRMRGSLVALSSAMAAKIIDFPLPQWGSARHRRHRRVALRRVAENRYAVCRIADLLKIFLIIRWF